MTRQLPSQRCFLLALCLLASLSVPAAAHAHGVWIAQRAGAWTLVLGEGPVDDAYEAAAVKRVTARRVDGADAPVDVLAKERNIALAAGPEVSAIAATFEDGYWSQAADGWWVAGTKTSVAGARKGGHYMKYTTTLLRSPERWAPRPFGLPLEIVPSKDPMRLKSGDALTVQVLFEGRPLPGARVVADYVGDTRAAGVKTDARGRATVRLRSSGTNVIKVSHSSPRTDRTEADEDGHSATYAFSLPQPRD